jgi:hypothetical protein
MTASIDALPRPEVTRLLTRGLSRHLARIGMSVVSELVLPNGRRVDLMALDRRGEIWIVEIKSSIEDFRADGKWRDYRAYCDRFLFASHLGVPGAIFPEEAGYILCDGFDAEIIRQSERAGLAGATRKALILEMARLASLRLLALTDPEGRFDGRF